MFLQGAPAGATSKKGTGPKKRAQPETQKGNGTAGEGGGQKPAAKKRRSAGAAAAALAAAGKSREEQEVDKVVLKLLDKVS